MPDRLLLPMSRRLEWANSCEALSASMVCSRKQAHVWPKPRGGTPGASSFGAGTAPVILQRVRWSSLSFRFAYQASHGAMKASRGQWRTPCWLLASRQAHFDCEAGCGHQVGAELPAYVSSPTLDTYQQCLVSDISVSSCSAKFAKTSRLCRCVPNTAT